MDKDNNILKMMTTLLQQHYLILLIHLQFRFIYIFCSLSVITRTYYTLSKSSSTFMGSKAGYYAKLESVNSESES
jgi:capsular polysaccharide biosynthesis protein